jgi:hypothetical protein
MGLSPMLVFAVLPIAFIIGSILLFMKTSLAPYLYTYIAMTLCHHLSNASRLEFIQLVFGKSTCIRIRLSENVMAALPFGLFLIWKGFPMFALAAMVISVLLAFVSTRESAGWVIPTPFQRFPFEFPAGFRKTWIVIVLSYLILIASALWGNFFVGLSALIILAITGMTYYSNPENFLIVWVNSACSGAFLGNKLRTAAGCFASLSLPLVLILAAIYPERIAVIAGAEILGLLIVWLGLLSKYSAFPAELSPQKITILMFVLMIPVLLPLALPALYFQAKERLRNILG